MNKILIGLVVVLAIGCVFSFSDKKNNALPITSSNGSVLDSLINIFCFKKGDFKIKKGDLNSCKDDIKFIENSLLRRVPNIKEIGYCVESGLINTDIKSVDEMRNLELNYYIISNDQGLSHYKSKIDSLEYDLLTPVINAPYTNYHFVVDNYLVLISHYGLSTYYPKYDIKKYMVAVKGKLQGMK